MWALFRALQRGWTVETLHELTKIDPWFLEQFREIVELRQMAALGAFREMSADLLRTLKRAGFSDADIAARARRGRERRCASAGSRTGWCPPTSASTPARPSSSRSRPTCTARFEQVCEAEPTPKKKVIILGSGPNRIGQGIEFDYCCCHAVFGFREEGFETVMVNCNPETVSTDYDTADRLYFEPLTFEDVMAIVERERSAGGDVSCVVQFGGQTPLKLALALQEAGVHDPRHVAGLDRPGRGPQALLAAAARPRRAAAGQRHRGVARAGARRGRARRLSRWWCGRPTCSAAAAWPSCSTPASLDRYMTGAVDVSHDRPVLIDRFLEDAFEFDVDAVADATGAVVIGGIMEHIEEAGIHSGDSSCVVPPFMVAERHLGTIREYTRRIARALKVVGPDEHPVRDQGRRGLRARGEPALVAHGALHLEGHRHADGEDGGARGGGPHAGRAGADATTWWPSGVFVKSPVFPFVRFPGVDTILGPEMKSTGEVMGGSDNFGSAFNKAMLGAGQQLPESGCVFISVNNSDKPTVLPIAQGPGALGLHAGGHARHRRVPARRTASRCEMIYKVNEGRPNVADHLVNRDIDMVINTPLGRDSFFDDRAVRRAATMAQVPCITTLTGASAAVSAIQRPALAHAVGAVAAGLLQRRSRHVVGTPDEPLALWPPASGHATDPRMARAAAGAASPRLRRCCSRWRRASARRRCSARSVLTVPVTVTVVDAQRPARHRPHAATTSRCSRTAIEQPSRSSPTSACR